MSLLELALLGALLAPITEIQPVNSNTEYEVEDILDYKLVREKPRYLIKWRDYLQSENTWEPKSSLNCSEKLTSYHC
jgi:hypothetical protein